MTTILKNFTSSYKLLFHLSLFIILSVCISITFPMFFREDDASHLYWAAQHNLYDTFNVRIANPSGGYRPITMLFFSIAYRLFGLNPFSYQVTCTAVFLLDFYLLYYLSKTYFSKSTGIVTLIIYCALFYNHFQMAFWFSDIVFSMHIMFAFLSIIFYLKSKEKIYYITFSYLFAFMGSNYSDPTLKIHKVS